MTGTVALIRPEIAAFAVPVTAVSPYPGNARRGNLDKIKASLRKHGQYKEILAQASTGHILIGNNTYAAMLDLGYAEVAVKLLDVDDVKAKEMLLIDNASSDDAEYDEAALAALLADIPDWDASGFTPDDLDDLLLKLQDNATDPAAALPPEVAAQAPQVLPAVPATDAQYSESPEAEAARQEKFDSWTPRYAKGLTEVILVYPEDDRTELLRLIEAAKLRFGGDCRNAEVVMGAVRLLTEVFAADAASDLAIDVATALEHARPREPSDPTSPASGETSPPSEGLGDGLGAAMLPDRTRGKHGGEDTGDGVDG